jgi:hypothetical protein
LVWRKILTGTSPNADMPVKMILDSSGKPVVCMALRNNQSGLDYGVFRLDTNSTILMQYAYNGSGNDQDIPYSVIGDNLNNIYVTGSSRNTDTLGSEDIVSMKIAPAGTPVWIKRYKGPGSGIDYGTSAAIDNSGNLYVGGASDKGGNHLEYVLLKYGPSGIEQWEERYSRITNSEDFVYSVATDNDQNIFLTGISFDSLSDYDIATIKYSEAIGINPVSNQIPQEMALYQNYPNPFNPQTKIKFELAKSEIVTLTLYDVSGRELEVLIHNKLNTGVYEIEFNASRYPTGVYFYKFQSASVSISRKMILIK